MAVHLTVPEDSGQSRLWGIPWLGIVARWIICIPQLIVLGILSFVFYFVVLVNWIPILVNGRQAGLIVDIFALLARIQSRTVLFIALATGLYPGIIDPADHPIRVEIDRDEPQNRLWGIPFLGLVVRAILIIPHAIVLWVLGILVGLLFLVSWAPILVNGRQSRTIASFFVGFYRYALRVAAYLVLVTGQYPPFRFSD